MATSHRQAPLVGSDHISGWHIGNTIETFDLCHILGDPELALHKIESLFFHIRDIHKFPHLSRWEHGHHFQMNGFPLKVEQVPSLYPWVQSKGWGVQAVARPRSDINYYQLLMFLFNELSRTPMRPPCTHESHNQVESLTRDLRRPYEASKARTWTTLSTLIGVCQQAGSYHNLYVWFVVPDVEVLG